MSAGDGLPLRVQLLGPVRAWQDRQELNLGAPQQRAVLAVLAMNAGQAVSRRELIDAVWGGPVNGAGNTLYTYISRLRRVLEPGRSHRGQETTLLGSGAGYQLHAEPGQVDVGVFADQVAAGRRAKAAGELTEAARILEAALGLWQGTPLGGLAGAWAQHERVRLDEARLAAAEEHAEVKLALGCHAGIAADLTALVSKYPLREGLRCQLMLALQRSGRQAEALAVFEDTRQVLDAQLGIEPGPQLRDLHQQILTGDPALQLSTPALQPALPVPRELPADVGAFTGRHTELAELDQLLPGASPETPSAVVIGAVSGTAGVGKTALAVHWAHRAQPAFPDGQLYVNLRGYDPQQPVPATEALAQFLRALGTADSDIPLEETERATRFRSAVAGRRLLVVLDNAATVEQVRPLLPGSPTVMVVVTSRDSLAGLVARDGAHRLDLDLLPTAEAVALLRTLIGDRVTADPAAAITLAGQCARLPLALRVAAELAVARPADPLASLASELASQQDRLDLLDAGGDPRGAVASVFSWSYRHLPPDAAGMFRLLGLHPSVDWDRYAAAALASARLGKASQLLAVLSRAHLIQPAGPNRYGMHDLLRAYAAGLAGQHDSGTDRNAAQTRLLDYYLATCAAAMDILVPAERYRRPQPPDTTTPAPDVSDQATARAWLDAELATLATIAAHTASNGRPGYTTQLAATLGGHYLDGHYTEGLIIHQHALDAARRCGDLAAQARTLIVLGQIHTRQWRPERAVDCLGQAVPLAADSGDRLLQARVQGALASAYAHQGHYRQARGHYEQALTLYTQIGDRVGQGTALSNLGLVDIRQSHYDQALRNNQRALAVFRELGHRIGEIGTLNNLGEVHFRRGEYQQAAAHQREALAVAREIGWRIAEANALVRLGDVFHRQGLNGQADISHQRALTLFREIGDRGGEAEALNGTGDSLLATGKIDQAHNCHTSALALATQAGNQREQARALTKLGQVCHARGDHEQGAEYSHQALALYREAGDRGGEAESLNGAGEALLAAGQAGQAHTCHTTALALTEQTGDRYQLARAHHGLAGACQASGQRGAAAEHWEQAREMYASLGVPEATRMGTRPGVPALRLVKGGAAAAAEMPAPAREVPAAAPEAEPGAGLRFGILGPLDVRDGTVACTPTPPKVRRVLAVLLLRANQVVPLSSLIEELWGDEPPHSAVTTVQTYIYQLRRTLAGHGAPSGWLATTAPGYLLQIGPAQLDADTFGKLSAKGRQLLDSGQPGPAADVLRQALDLWRGPALANVTTGRLLEAHVVHLEEERLRALELRILADAQLGRHQALIGELRSLVAAHPLNEWFHGQLIASLSCAGRRSEALQAYQSLRALLREELGIDPRPELQRLQQDVLSLDSPDSLVFAQPAALAPR